MVSKIVTFLFNILALFTPLALASSLQIFLGKTGAITLDNEDRRLPKLIFKIAVPILFSSHYILSFVSIPFRWLNVNILKLILKFFFDLNRFILIKYADRGMIEGQKKTPFLVDILYSIVTTSLMSVFLICSLIHLIRQKEKEVIEITTFSKLQFGWASVFLVMIVMMYLSIQYKTRHGRLQVPNIQRNVLTFKQSCLSYIFFSVTNLIIFIIRINKNNQWFSVFRTRQIASIIFIAELFAFNIFIPLLVINNLRSVMPQLFNDKQEKCIEFYYNVTSIMPREQKFLQYKPFKYNARFGSEVKFKTIESNLKPKPTLTSIEC